MNWIIVYSSNNLQQIELPKHILNDNGSDPIVLNKQGSDAVSIGELSMMVNRSYVLQLKKTITEAAL